MRTPLNQPITLPEPVVCKCTYVHFYIPAGATHLQDSPGSPLTGYYWQCKCGSTALLPSEKPKEEAA